MSRSERRGVLGEREPRRRGIANAMRALMLFALCACSSPASSGGASEPTSEPRPEPAATPPPVAPPKVVTADVAQLIAPEVTGVLKSSGAESPIASYVSTLLKKPPACWTQLLGSVTVAYQLMVPASSYFIFEGTLLQRDVEQCVQQAFASVLPMTIEHDGALAVFRSKAGVVYAKWSTPFIIVGSKDQVMRAAATPQSRDQWTERLAQFPPGQTAMWSTDSLFQNLLGVASTGYLLVVERVTKAPHAFFSARVVARFATDGDAAIIARRIRQGEVAIPSPPAELVGGLKQMKVKQSGPTVEVAFDSDMFFGMELEKLQQWVARLSRP